MSIFGNVAGMGAIQPDWAQTDERRADFIRNKPDFSDVGEAFAQVRALAEAALPKAGGTLEGDLFMDGNQLMGLPDPREETGAATKGYVDMKLLSVVVQLPAVGWSGEEAPFTQRAEVSWIVSTDQPHYGAVYSGSLEQKLAQKEAFSLVDDLDSVDGGLIFSCFEEKPTVDLTIQLQVNRATELPDQDIALLMLTEETDTPVQAEIDGQSYGIENATVNEEPTATTYDFTVL